MVKIKTPAGKENSVLEGTTYNRYLDVLKGFAILLVVLGHSLQTHVANGNFDSNVLFRVIYSFHMPLFMFLAGAAAAYSRRPMNLEFMRRKFYMLVVPFISWYLFTYWLLGTYHNVRFVTYIHLLINNPDNGLWFLWVLFLNFVALTIIYRIYKWFKLYSYLIVWLAVYALPISKYGIGLVRWHLPFFLLGYLIFKYKSSLIRLKIPAYGVSIILAPILVASWHRLSYPSFISSLPGRLTAHGFQVITVGDIGSVNVSTILTLLYMYAVPLSAIGFVFWFFKLGFMKFSGQIFTFFGLYTLEVYALNLILLRYGFGGGWIRIASSFVIASTLSVAIGRLILRRVAVLSFLFLGGRMKPAPLKIKN